MKVILDTCTFLWLALEPDRLSPRARSLFDDRTTEPHLSMVSVLEIALKYRAGKLPLPLEPSDWIPSRRSFFHLIEIPLTEAVIFRSGELSSDHDDPFDRLLAATAMEAGATILSPDPQLSLLGASRIW
ncbi:MAG TPA: type II toxin-antitoxin system VapC family toxin [Kiritimatiellia bacterium]|nr:type II toxin-antitoxin system VapC family toxin [Kiritimatiellia bacterium]HMP97425.1 type II toxin-antitoxin system VapC family toxin [Kiritimatiellia bacterium]